MTPDGEALRRRLLDEFPEAAGREDEVRLVRAPGRVNLIGEHTDYNDGWVLPAAIDLETWIAYLAAGDARVELVLASDGARDGFDLDAIGPPRESWIDTVAGMAWSLGAAGMPLRGVRGVVATTIPIGSGLSSSAALQVAAAWAMSERHPPTEPMELALLARRAENEYVGVRSGVMDQFASAHGRSDAALLLDCRSLEWEPVPLPLEQYAVVVCDTRSPRRLETSEYNRRRAQCDEAVQVIARHHPGVASLRDVTAQMLDGTPDLDAVVRHRAEHVVHENRRVLEAVDALRDGDLARVGRLFAESHRSLRDQYEVTSPELDALVEIASRTPGVAAARMTGAGFGGCTVNLVEHGAVERLAAAVAEEYPRRAGREAGVYRVDLAAGAGEVA
ncbi:MAG TPA: galactokinase [Candidatus Limnocylindria bacterium]|nr:galactokinase [Candidatus Limnocylindria bacterium]